MGKRLPFVQSGAFAASVVGVDAHIDPAGCTAFYGNLRQIRNCPMGRQSRRPLQKASYPPYSVGADDSVRPAECTVFLQKSSANSYAPRLPLGSRGAGQKGLRGFERCKFRKYSESCSVSHPSRLRRATSPYRAGHGKRRLCGAPEAPRKRFAGAQFDTPTAGAGVPDRLERRLRFISVPRCFRRQRGFYHPAGRAFPRTGS